MKPNKRLGRGLNALIPTENQNDGDIEVVDRQQIDVALGE